MSGYTPQHTLNVGGKPELINSLRGTYFVIGPAAFAQGITDQIFITSNASFLSVLFL